MERVGVILFIPRTVSKHKIQLLPCKVFAILFLSKDRVANLIPECGLIQNYLTNHNEWKIWTFWERGWFWGKFFRLNLILVKYLKLCFPKVFFILAESDAVTSFAVLKVSWLPEDKQLKIFEFSKNINRSKSYCQIQIVQNWEFFAIISKTKPVNRNDLFFIQL